MTKNILLQLAMGLTLFRLDYQPRCHLNRVDQQTLPLDHKYTASQYTGKSVNVYVLDTGIHYNHSVFNGRAHYPGCDPIDKLEHKAREGEDCNGHGTHVAGLVGGNGTGLATSVTLFTVTIQVMLLKHLSLMN